MTTTDETKGLDETLELLAREFSGWKFWRSAGGRMIGATRIDETAGISPTLIEDSVEEMREAVEREQAAARRPYKPGRMGL